MSGVSVLSPMPEESPLKERKGMPVFFVKTLVLQLSGSRALLVGKRNDKIQGRRNRGKRRRKAKGTNIPVWGPRRTDHWTICGKASEAVFNVPS